MTRKLCTLLFLVVSVISFAKEYTFSPEDVPAMKRLMGSGKLQPGDVVVLQDGTYVNLEEIDFTGKGTFDKPIVWKAQNPGKAVISGKLNLKIYGEYLQLEGLFFYQAWALGHDMINFQKEKGVYANYCRMTHCVIDDCNDPQKKAKSEREGEYWVGLRGMNNRIDHCYFANKRIGGLVLQVWLDADNHLNNNMIDHNFFGERQPYGANGAEIIRIGHSWSSQLESRTIVEDNVFFRCSGENEIISVKSCHNVLRRNLFYESQGGLVCRHGHYNVIESNTFIGHNLRGTAGIRIINQGHTVYDNYIKDVSAFGLLVRVGVYERPTPETDVKKEPLTSYHRVENVDIAYNTFLNCSLELGSGRGDKLPKNVRFANNLYAGEVPQLKIINADELLPGFLFMDNHWAFTDKSTLDAVPYERMRTGFKAVGKSVGLDMIEKKRVDTCIFAAGPSWYQPSKEFINYIDLHR
nr:polysaccharide lyase 6 family protein [uncultured Bacteroides sp.]